MIHLDGALHNQYKLYLYCITLPDTATRIYPLIKLSSGKMPSEMLLLTQRVVKQA